LEKETTMYHADNPLHYHIITSFHDPDPDRALRYRPFVYGSRRHHLAARAGLPSRVSLRPGERIREFAGAVSRFVMPRRVDCAPCCSTPCG
jgi:hypothetical protein